MLVDALNAIKWALIFTGWSNEAGADMFTEWFLDRLRLANGNFGYIAALFEAVADMVALHMRGGMTFDDSFAATRAEAEWLKSVADKALDDHPKKGLPPKVKRSRTPVRRVKRSRSPLRRRRGEAGPKGRAKGGKQERGTKPSICGPGHKDWEARKATACKKFNKGKCTPPCPFKKDGLNHFCSICGKPSHGANICRDKED